MKVKFDFTLSRRFGVVEITIFRLILNGLTNARQISNLLWVFSEEVIANSVRKLVNQQIVCADLNSRTLVLSEPVMAIIDTCKNNSFEIEIPENLIELMSDGCLIISEPKVKEAIINQLLPGIKLGFLSNLLDFSISERSEDN